MGDGEIEDVYDCMQGIYGYVGDKEDEKDAGDVGDGEIEDVYDCM